MEEYIIFGGGIVSGLSPEMKPIHINLKDYVMKSVKVSIQKNKISDSQVSVILFEDGKTARFMGDVRERTDVILRDKMYKI
ncbi:hypothetical protein ZPAH1_orf00344 [Aeromonas phage ZPAH1]|nr:hypothetical protein ASwh1_298 [Aeromonas phage Aswh_1]QQG34106.1 hypothetical protein ZPAH1_orf00344 [Aeromonas phage ZPAH1]